jgi:hypothetical protein
MMKVLSGSILKESITWQASSAVYLNYYQFVCSNLNKARKQCKQLRELLPDALLPNMGHDL